MFHPELISSTWVQRFVRIYSANSSIHILKCLNICIDNGPTTSQVKSKCINPKMVCRERMVVGAQEGWSAELEFTKILLHQIGIKEYSVEMFDHFDDFTNNNTLINALREGSVTMSGAPLYVTLRRMNFLDFATPTSDGDLCFFTKSANYGQARIPVIPLNYPLLVVCILHICLQFIDKLPLVKTSDLKSHFSILKLMISFTNVVNILYSATLTSSFVKVGSHTVPFKDIGELTHQFELGDREFVHEGYFDDFRFDILNNSNSQTISRLARAIYGSKLVPVSFNKLCQSLISNPKLVWFHTCGILNWACRPEQLVKIFTLFAKKLPRTPNAYAFRKSSCFIEKMRQITNLVTALDTNVKKRLVDMNIQVKIEVQGQLDAKHISKYALRLQMKSLKMIFVLFGISIGTVCLTNIVLYLAAWFVLKYITMYGA